MLQKEAILLQNKQYIYTQANYPSSIADYVTLG